MTLTKKRHISSLRKHTGSKGCTKSQECYQIKASCLIKTLKNGIQVLLFKTNHIKEIILDLKIFIFLDNYSTMELLCNSDLVKNIKMAGKKMASQVNGGTLAANHNATLPRYKQDVWFSKYAITNTITLKNWLSNIEWNMIASIKYSWCIGRINKN